MKKMLKISLLTLSTLSLNSMANVNPEIIVKFKNSEKIVTLPNVQQIQHLFDNTYVLRTNSPTNVESYLKKNYAIAYLEYNQRAEPTKLPTAEKISAEDLVSKADQKNNTLFNDPQVNKVWAFNDATNHGVSVNAAYRVHAESATTPVIVAVVDTGVDYTHEDLKDVMWTNPGEIPNNNIDDDQNGYIDDVYGINTLKRTANGIATGNPMDTHSHGTHVAGTIGAKQNNRIGIAGIASNVKIMAIRTVPNSGDETDVDVAESFLYAAKNGAKLINCSFGKSSNEGKNLVPDTIKYIGEKYGTLVVAAAGNDSSDIDKKPTFPASHQNDHLLIIASTTNTGSMSYFSNYGKLNVDVAAPGSSVFSTTPGNRYESMSGTSMATPTTVGVLAEILSHHPELSPIELKNAIMTNVTKVAKFKNKMISEGRVDLLNTLDALK